MVRKEILELIIELTILLPEQRIGQIIFNYINAQCVNNNPFHIQDADLLGILKKKVSEIKDGGRSLSEKEVFKIQLLKLLEEKNS